MTCAPGGPIIASKAASGAGLTADIYGYPQSRGWLFLASELAFQQED